MASASKSPSILIPIANGSEEMEAIIIADVLRRAEAQVTLASVEETTQVTCSRGVNIVADKVCMGLMNIINGVVARFVSSIVLFCS